MAIQDYKSWKKDTALGFAKPQTSRFKALNRAMKAYDKDKSSANRKAIAAALKDWINLKDPNGAGLWKNRGRNAKGAIENLHAELQPDFIALAVPAARSALKSHAVIAAYQTMTDDNHVQSFADHCKDCFRNHWNKSQPVATGERLMQGLTNIHTACGIPAFRVDIKALPPGYNGFFNFQTWTIEISDAKFSSYDMVWDPAGQTNTPHAYFVNIAETLYHEARHCEQWWHMARYSALGDDANKVAMDMGIPLTIANQAKARPMKHGDPMDELTRGWLQSVYGESKRGIVLHALGLKRNAHPSPKLNPGETGGTLVHAAYSGDLAEEVDAWGIQDLVRAKF